MMKQEFTVPLEIGGRVLITAINYHNTDSITRKTNAAQDSAREFFENEEFDFDQ